MGEIAFAATVSHAPGITGFREAAGAQAERYYAGMAKLREAFEAAKPDAIIEIFDDHFTNFYVDNMPAICVGVGGSHFGPAEEESFLKIPRGDVPGHPDLARSLVREAFTAGFELSVSQRLLLDHGSMVPLHFVTPTMNVPSSVPPSPTKSPVPTGWPFALICVFERKNLRTLHRNHGR